MPLITNATSSYFNHSEYYVIDGIDGVGKTTQLNFLEQHFSNLNYKIIRTRALGGKKDSELEKIRDFIFSNTLDAEIEEPLIAATVFANCQLTADSIRQHQYPYRTSKPIVVLQDRGSLSHLSYAMARGFSKNRAMEIHQGTLSSNKILKIVNVILLPSDIDAIFRRVRDRGDLTAFSEKYEKEEMQLKVLSIMMKELKGKTKRRGIKHFGDFRVVMVEPQDTPLMLHQKVLKAIE